MSRAFGGRSFHFRALFVGVRQAGMPRFRIGDLASFAGRAVTRLGREKSAIDERVSTEAPFQIYQRTASFNRSRHRMLIEWSLAKNGEVTGLVVRPVPGDSL